MNTTIGGYIHRSASLAALLVIAFAVARCTAESPSAGSDALFKQLDADGDGDLAASEILPDHTRLFERLVRKSDVDGSRSLSREEFLAALVPTRPEKQIETKQPGSYPQADAVRYVLLTMDTRKDSWIEVDEVPEDMQPLYDAMVDRLDVNKNGSMDRYELSRGARELGQLAARYVARERINVAKELKKFDKAEGELAQRFDKNAGPIFESLGDPGKARKFFKQFDVNSDKKLVVKELPPPVQPQFERIMKLADRDRDGGLSEREFSFAAERISRFMGRQRPESPKTDPKQTERKSRRRAKQGPADAMPAEMLDESMPAETP
jgi:Ca2+-binding EF-hand superfamily protein